MVFPDHLKSHYQSYTQEDMSNLLSHIGFDIVFKNIKTGILERIDQLENSH